MRKACPLKTLCPAIIKVKRTYCKRECWTSSWPLPGHGVKTCVCAHSIVQRRAGCNIKASKLYVLDLELHQIAFTRKSKVPLRGNLGTVSHLSAQSSEVPFSPFSRPLVWSLVWMCLYIFVSASLLPSYSLYMYIWKVFADSEKIVFTLLCIMLCANNTMWAVEVAWHALGMLDGFLVYWTARTV